jgi:hypothetical protein
MWNGGHGILSTYKASCCNGSSINNFTNTFFRIGMRSFAAANLPDKTVHAKVSATGYCISGCVAA